MRLDHEVLDARVVGQRDGDRRRLATRETSPVQDLVHGSQVRRFVSERLADGERTHTPVGEGMSEWPAQFAALARDGYSGYCSLETHWRPTAALTEEVMNRPGGSAYTEGAEAGSRICLANIQSMLARLDPAYA